ncbi:hypothetical protein [Streptomyces sp. PA5.6]|uniref:hypothetical protein n=1 Tax=Streptomyces sp. PA5.6 TaxID=3035651 RepID=UPI0039046662
MPVAEWRRGGFGGTGAALAVRGALAADTVLRVAVPRLPRLNGGHLPQRTVRTAGPGPRHARVPFLVVIAAAVAVTAGLRALAG